MPHKGPGFNLSKILYCTHSISCIYIVLRVTQTTHLLFVFSAFVHYSASFTAVTVFIGSKSVVCTVYLVDVTVYMVRMV